MGESTRPQIKLRYSLRYTPVSAADTRLSTTDWGYQQGYQLLNRYYRILLLLPVRNKPTTSNHRDNRRKGRTRSQDREQDAEGRGDPWRRRDSRRRWIFLKKGRTSYSAKCDGVIYCGGPVPQKRTGWLAAWATEAEEARILRPLLSASSGAGSSGAGAEGGGGEGWGVGGASKQQAGSR